MNQSNKLSAKLSAPIFGLSLGLPVLALYLFTLQRTVVGICQHDYCADIGEFQVALPLWGTVHHTGYPLYMMLGSPFVNVLAWVGVAPAAAASLYSTLWQVLAVIALGFLLRRLSGSAQIGAGLALIFAVIEPIWMHGVIAEVYSLSIFFGVVILHLALDLRQSWSPRRAWLLALVCGLGVAHHRLLLFLILAMGIWLLPTFMKAERRHVRWLLGAVALGLVGFLPYIDIPLRMALGTTWSYSPDNTWESFWHIFHAREEAQRQLRLDLAPESLESNLRQTIGLLAHTLTWPGLLAVAAATSINLFTGARRWFALCVTTVLAAHLLIPVILPHLHLAEQNLMFGSLAAMLMLAVAAQRLPARVRVGVLAVCIVFAVGLGARNLPVITALTQDASGVAYAADVERADTPDDGLVMAPWGSAYFILSYAHHIEGRMPNRTIVDHRADFRTLTENGTRPLDIHVDHLHLLNLEWWQDRIGAAVQVRSAGVNMVQLTTAPPPSAPPSGIPLNDAIDLVDWEVTRLDDGRLHVRLEWAARRALDADYSTFVQASDRPAITGPTDIVGQNDFHRPVFGHHATQDWVVDTVVREDHAMSIPPGRDISTIVVGMYTREGDDFIRAGEIQLDGTDAWRATTR